MEENKVFGHKPAQLVLAAKQYWYDLSSILVNPQTWTSDMTELIQHTANDLLPEPFKDRVYMCVMRGRVNMRRVESHRNMLEIYISPKVMRDNIPLIEILYATRFKAAHLIVSKFAPYYHSQNINTLVPRDDFTLNYTDIAVHAVYGYFTGEQLGMSIIVVVSDSVADHILQKRTVKFAHDNGEESTREVLMPDKSDAIDVLINQTLGEYNLLNHVLYIEYVHESDPIAKNLLADGKLDELATLRGKIACVVRQRAYRMCDYCKRLEIQATIYTCSSCQTSLYCSVACQRADRPEHRKICLPDQSESTP